MIKIINFIFNCDNLQYCYDECHQFEYFCNKLIMFYLYKCIVGLAKALASQYEYKWVQQYAYCLFGSKKT